VRWVPRAVFLAVLAMPVLAAACVTWPPENPNYVINRACSEREAAEGQDTSAIFTAETVDHPAMPDKGNSAPRLGGPAGSVTVVEFVVDTLGRSDLCHARVRRETVPGHGSLLLAAAAGWRHSPAIKNGRKVRMRIVHVVERVGGPPAQR
jgi:hypothetical protein